MHSRAFQTTVLVLGITFLIGVAVFRYGTDVFTGDQDKEQFFTMRIEKRPVPVLVAKTADERTRGLSGRNALPEGIQGMLFYFDREDYHGIWMKDMKFPIDIIWISKEGVIVSIDTSVLPDSYPTTYRPKFPALYALETTARYAETFDIKVGDTVTFSENIEK